MSGLSIYELRNYARTIGMKQVVSKTRYELIEEISQNDTSFNLEKIKEIVFRYLEPEHNLRPCLRGPKG